MDLYKLATSNRPPAWLDKAGEAAFEGMDNAFKAIGKKLKKKKKGESDSKNALSME